MKTNNKPAERVYIEGDRVIKDFGSRISDAEKTLKDNRAMQSRWLLLRQFLLFSKFFLLADNRIRARARAIWVLLISALNFMRLLGSSRIPVKN